MKKLIDLIQEELVKAFTAAGDWTRPMQGFLFPTARICANTTATAQWQLQKHTTKHRSSWLKQL